MSSMFVIIWSSNPLSSHYESTFNPHVCHCMTFSVWTPGGLEYVGIQENPRAALKQVSVSEVWLCLSINFPASISGWTSHGRLRRHLNAGSLCSRDQQGGIAWSAGTEGLLRLGILVVRSHPELKLVRSCASSCWWLANEQCGWILLRHQYFWTMLNMLNHFIWSFTHT
jgi:hypothetical protein